MTTLLGRDFATTFAERFAGRLQVVAFTKVITGDVDPNNPVGPPAKSPTNYVADGIAFAYSEDNIDGENVIRGDYKVTMMIGSIMLANAVAASLDLGAHTSHVDVVAAFASVGTDGNAFTIELVADAPTGSGTIVEDSSSIRLGFLPSVTTVADIEALIAGSLAIVVKVSGTGATVLDAGDVLAPTLLAGGVTATPAPGIIPGIGDMVTVPPPGSTAPIAGTVISIPTLTHAQVTCQVRGLGL